MRVSPYGRKQPEWMDWTQDAEEERQRLTDPDNGPGISGVKPGTSSRPKAPTLTSSGQRRPSAFGSKRISRPLKGPVQGALAGAQAGRGGVSGALGGAAAGARLMGAGSLTDGMPGAFNGDVLSFLSQAREAIGDGGLSEALNAISARESNYKDQAKTADARLAAMYDQLRGSILDDSEAIRDTTGAAREGMSEIAAEEKQAIADAYQATQGRQDEVLGRLGIEDAQAIAQAQGDVQGRSMREIAERASTRNAAAQEFTTSVGQNAENFNTSNAAAAGLEGTSRRADVQQQLSSALAALSDERNSTRAQIAQANQDRALSLAQSLLSSAQSNWQSRQSNWMDRFNIERQADDTAYDRAMTEREFALREQAAMAEANAAANAGPAWNQLAAPQQMQQQISQMAGRNAPQVLNILGQNTNSNGSLKRGALDQLKRDLRLSDYEANAYISMYSGALNLG